MESDDQSDMLRGGQESGAGAREGERAPGSPDGGSLGRQLGGDMPCCICGYNLRGLSVRSLCPECGTSLRATILSLVDPMASELQPIHLPRMLAAGLMLWNWGALVAAVLCWLPQVSDLLSLWDVTWTRPAVAGWVVVAMGVSALGAATLVRPHARIPWWYSVLVVVGVLLYFPLGFAAYECLRVAEVSRAGRYVEDWSPGGPVAMCRIVAALATFALVMSLRPMARVLVARSLAMRTGRVDRQTMYAVAAASLVVAAGHGVAWLAGHSAVERLGALAWVLEIAGIALIATGSMLVTLGVAGGLVDSVRIALAVLMPSPTLRQVIRRGSEGVATTTAEGVGQVLSGKSGIWRLSGINRPSPMDTPRPPPSSESGGGEGGGGQRS